METFLFFVFSTFEYAAIILLLTALFRLPMRDYLVPIICIAMLESLLSYFLRFTVQLANLSVLLQILIMIVAFKYFSRIQWFYSSIAVLVSYCTYSTLQIVIFMAMNYLGLFEMEQLSKEIINGVTLIGYILQFVTVVAIVAIVGIIKLRNLGWQFIPDAYRKVNYFDPLNTALSFMVFTSVILLGSMVYLSILANRTYLLILLAFLTFCLSALIHFSNKKERLDN